jgi:hypothetical protein
MFARFGGWQALWRRSKAARSFVLRSFFGARSKMHHNKLCESLSHAPRPTTTTTTNNSKCKEVRCKPLVFKDGYGAELDRKEVCYDPAASVVVMITDTCPCHYPGNAYSNKRWCVRGRLPLRMGEEGVGVFLRAHLHGFILRLSCPCQCDTDHHT